MCAPTGDERRLFLALWPGDAERRQLAELAAAVAGRRRVRDANLHLTLVFLGATDAARLAAYEAALTDLAVPSLELILDRYGYWPRPRILWLGSSHTPPELYELVAELHRRLHGCGFTPERRCSRRILPWPASFPVQLRPSLPSRRSTGGSTRWRWSSRNRRRKVRAIECRAAGQGARFDR